MPKYSLNLSWMAKALIEARKAARLNEVPVGAVLELDGKMIAKGHNLTRIDCDPTAHAEIVVLRKAGQILGSERLIGSTLYVTLEPCAMCAGAIVQARVKTVVYGAKDPKAGACGSVFKIIPNRKLNHRPEVVSNIMSDRSVKLLRDFFKKRRK
jgi:tRNA(adenine34) deaminase